MSGRDKQFRSFILFFVLLAWFASDSFINADNQSGQLLSLDTSENSESFFSEIAKDIGETFSSPFDWDSKDILLATAFVGGGALLYSVDEQISDWVQKQKTPLTCSIARVVEVFGSAKKAGIGVGLFYLGTLLSGKDNKTHETAKLLVRSALSTYLAVKLIKVVGGRERPDTIHARDKKNGRSKSKRWHWFTFDNDYNSFPSGHSAMAFSLATVLAMQYKPSSPKKINAVGILSYSIATLTALSRVHDLKHWPSDILIGSALGYFITRHVVKRYRKENDPLAMELFLNGPKQPDLPKFQPYSSKHHKGQLRLYPVLDINGIGLGINFQY